MFVRPDYDTKIELSEAIERGDKVTVWSDVKLSCPKDGEFINVYGPRAAVLAHRQCMKDHSLCTVTVWSARVLWERGKIVLVK